MSPRTLEIQLHGRRVGLLVSREDYSCFHLDEDFITDPERAVLGLEFEDDPRKKRCNNMRVPVWFSNLLPEGRLRTWVAEDRLVSPDREFELLTRVGSDLPGAVMALPTDSGEGTLPAPPPHENDGEPTASPSWKFSLAGVQLKFSMLQEGDRFTMPAVDGAGGDWIVKTPDHRYPRVPVTELAMMRLAALAGIEVPETQLVHRDALPDLPARVWPEDESWAYAVKRFDRIAAGERVHIEDLAQVRGFMPADKYRGSFETIAALIYRGHDLPSLEEFVRRLAFNLLIHNGDAHLKNWSLIYRDPRMPVLSPAYDLVATGAYVEDTDLGLRFGGSKRFDDVRLDTFRRLGGHLGVDGSALATRAEEVISATLSAWPSVEEEHLACPFGRKIRETLSRSAALLHR